MSGGGGPGRFGVIGHPVAHSLSPQIHAAFGRQTGIAIDYRTVDAPPDAFAATVRRFVDDDGRGLNVTLPFKEQAHALCGGRLSPRAVAAGAVNTLDCRDGGVAGDNTDGVGLVADLQRLLGGVSSLAGANVLLIGAGGSARGVIAPLFDAGIDRMTIAARDPSKAAALAVAFAPRPIEAASLAQVGGQRFDVLVNATSASLAGAALPIDASAYAQARLAYDLMYGAQPTRFLVDASAAGAATTADGLGMLVEQAAESFLVWHGTRPETAPVLALLRARLDATLA